MRKLFSVIKFELLNYFFSPVSYILSMVFLLLLGFTTFSLGSSSFFYLNEASLVSFFAWHSRVFLLMIPAICMQTWADEKRFGTIELLFVFPIKIWQLVLGKFFASWIFVSFILLLSLPTVFAVNYLGEPDFGVISCGYCAAILMAGVFIAVTIMTSALVKKAVLSFVLSFVILLFLILFGDSSLTDFFKDSFPPAIFDMVTALSITSHFDTLCRGIIDFRDIFYFISMIFLPLTLCVIALKSLQKEN